MKKALIAPGAIIIAFIAGGCLPEAHTFRWLMRWLLITMLFLACLPLDLSQMRIQRRHGLLLLINLATAIIPWTFCTLCGWEKWAEIVFYLGITPTATAAPVVVGFLGGNVGFIVAAFIVTNIGIACGLPFLLPMVGGEFSWALAGEVAANLAILLVLPLLLSRAIRRLAPGTAHLPPWVKRFSFSVWVVNLFIIASCAGEFTRNNQEMSVWTLVPIAAYSLGFCIFNFRLGRYLGKKDLRLEMSQGLGQKNTSFTIVLAVLFADPLVSMGPTFYVLWHNLWNAWQMFRMGKKK